VYKVDGFLFNELKKNKNTENWLQDTEQKNSSQGESESLEGEAELVPSRGKGNPRKGY